MAKHTEGAVHLTSLSLDLTQFNENIQQIQNSTAEVADVAVQNLSKIKEALNVPTEQMRLSVDTQQFTQDINVASQAVQDFSNNTTKAFKQIENAGKLTDENISSLLRGLNLQGDDSAVRTLEDLRDALDDLGIEYSKIQLTTKDGELFRAIAESADESGRKIQSTFDLTGETVERIKAQIVENSKQTSKAFKEQTVSVDALKVKLKDLEIASKTFSAVISDSDIKSSAMDVLIQQSAQFELNLQDVISKMQSGALTTNEADAAYKNLSSTLSHLLKLWGNVNREAKTAATATTTVDEINKLALNYANLAKQMGTSKAGNLPGMEGMATEIKATEEQLKSLAQSLSAGNITAKEATGIVDQLSSAYTIYKVRLADAEQEQNKYTKSLAPIKQETQATISSLKTLEKTAVFKTSKDKVAALRAEYEEFLNKLKNTNVGVDEAEKELSDLQKQFDELESTVKRGNGTLENWVNKITESAKWQIANSALNLLQQSFGQLTTTIIDTEDAVIELRRVLNDKSLVDSEMTQTLYDIAYEFGQTFDNVQEVAVKFAQTGKTWEETVAATRATMLGLNTAELEVSTATEGLIAVMAQFNVEADDLEKVIDKINITADNFPVTSEKIVAALQRAGGTANAFNMTLDETIATITALAEKTGRSGENIGTALNSLIIFTSKSENLKLFSSLSAEMDDVVKKFQAGSGSIIDVWTQLSKEIGRLSKEQEDALFNSAAFEQFASQFEAEAAEYAGTIQQIYGTAGAYRRNYLTVLLQDMSTVEDVMANLTGAIGYSLQENEVAMESFSKKWNQLIVSAKELAIQFGEAGFLDLMKGAVEASSAVLQLTKSIGGLKTVLVALTVIILAIKKEKIKDRLTKLVPVIHTLTGATKLYEMALLDGATRMQAFGVATQSVLGALGGWVTIAGVAVTAIAAITNAQKQAAEEARVAREEIIAQGKESVKTFSDLGVAYQEYKKAVESSNNEEIISSRNSILQSLGYEAEDINMLISMYGDEKTAVQELIKEKYELMQIDAEEAYKAITSEEKRKEISKSKIEASQADKKYLELLVKQGKDYGNVLDELNNKLEQSQLGLTLGTTNIDITPEVNLTDLYSVDRTIEDLNRRLKDYQSVISVADQKTSTLYQTTKTTRDVLEKYKNEVRELEYQYELSQLSVEEYTERLLKLQEETQNALPGNEALTSALEEMEGTIDSLNKKMDDFQSSAKSVESIITQYNQTGVMTADMLQTLIGLAPEYIDLIDINSNSLSLNQEKLENLMKVNDNYMVQMAAMKVAKEYEALSTELQQEKYDNLTVAEIQNMITTNALGGEIYQLAMQLYSGQINADQFRKEIQQAGEKSGMAANKVAVLTDSMVDLATSMGGVIQLAGMFPNLSLNASVKVNGKTIEEWEKDRQRGIISEATFQKYLEQSRNMAAGTSSSGTKTWFPSTTTKTGGSGAGGNADKFKAEKDALSDLLEVYEHSILLIEHNEKDSAKAGKEIAAIYRKMQDEVHAQAERYRVAGVSENDELIRNLQKSWLDYADKIEEALHGIYEETVAAHERAINYLEHQYDSAEQRLDYSFMGENLKKQLDYQVKIQREAERELERLAQLGMDANSEAAQDVIDTWYDAEKSIRDISQKIQESILQPYEDFIDLADKFDIWEYMDFTKVDYLRMELQEVNNMLANGTMSLKEYNSQLKQLSYAIYDAQKELFDKQKADVEAAKDEVVKGYKSDIDSLKDQKEQIEDYYKTVIDGYNAEIDAWEDRKDKITDYYDTLIDNLNDVQAANERINAQVDYYNERQKIVTNLEQAQARSGVEWREKEMEYQQSLIDLDEEWNRTQKEWDIQDQIDMLNELKERALADIDLSIQAIRATIEAAEQAKTAAIEVIEAEIAGIEEAITATEQKAEEEIALIDEQFKMLSQTIAEAIKNGTADGVANTQAEIDKALVDGTNAMLSFIDSTNQTFTQTSQETANTVYGIYDTSFITPMYGEINNIASHMQTAMTEGASGAAQAALTQFRNSFITPLKNEMASILSQSEKAKQAIATTTPQTSTITTSTSGKFVKPDYDLLKSHQQMVDWAKTSPIVYINNNNLSRESGAKRTQTQLVQSILNSH